MRTICVFCGSGTGTDAVFALAAEALGKEIAARNMRLVYGGAKVGLMGLVARGALSGNGEVIGVIPKDLVRKGVALEELKEIKVVGSMHERKAMMMELSDAFIALPGGFGTMEELFEVLAWGQLGIHSKPCGLLNIGGYYDELLSFLDKSVEKGFIHPENRKMVLVAVEPAEMLNMLKDYKPPVFDKAKWILKQ